MNSPANLGVAQAIEEVAGQVLGQANNGEVLANVDGANLGALNATLVSQCTHNSACGHARGTANIELVVDHTLVIVRALCLTAAAVRIIVREGARVTGNIFLLSRKNGRPC